MGVCSDCRKADIRRRSTTRRSPFSRYGIFMGRCRRMFHLRRTRDSIRARAKVMVTGCVIASVAAVAGGLYPPEEFFVIIGGSLKLSVLIGLIFGLSSFFYDQ